MSEQPAHNLRIIGERTAATMLVRIAARTEVAVVLYIQHNKRSNLRFGQALCRIDVMQFAGPEP